MILTKTKLETMTLKGAASYRLYGYAGTKRFRLALGTKKATETTRWRNAIAAIEYRSAQYALRELRTFRVALRY
jgi:hypothetical protein